jgi:CO dehydrogenase/acetyl-CoA synthase alpha subunit
MEICLNDEVIEAIDDLRECFCELINQLVETAVEVANAITEKLEEHKHCYSEDEVKHYYNKSKGCMCKKVTYACECGKKFYETYECYEPPPKQKNKNSVLEKNKKRYYNHN